MGQRRLGVHVSGGVRRGSKAPVQSGSKYGYRAAIAVERRMIDELVVEGDTLGSRQINTNPRAHFRTVEIDIARLSYAALTERSWKKPGVS
ncbi:MAG: hypothetical protein QOJ40_1473 [Verrucomicrobiota bacterium]